MEWNFVSGISLFSFFSLAKSEEKQQQNRTPSAADALESFVIFIYFLSLFIFVNRKFMPFYYIAITDNSFQTAVCRTASIFINAQNLFCKQNKKCTIIFFLFPLHDRYGREDEEVMGLKFCNEAIIALEEIWPTRKEEVMPLSPLQVC